MYKHVRMIVACAALAVLFLVGSQFYSQNEKQKVEDESSGLAQQVIALCQNSDPATVEKLVAAGVCANAKVVNTPGATGEVGPMGPQGPQGGIGRQGIPGIPGEDGQPGPPGADGLKGADGLRGADGQNGADGKTGPAGADGKTGPQGERGPTGPQGPQGPAGADGRTPTYVVCSPQADGDLTSFGCVVTSWE